MPYYGNDWGNNGRQIQIGSPEYIKARTEAQANAGRLRSPGWWPSGATILRVVLIGVLVILAIAWGLTLLNH